MLDDLQLQRTKQGDCHIGWSHHEWYFGVKEIDLELAEKLCEYALGEQSTATILNDAGNVTKIYTKPVRNIYNFPKKFTLKLFKNPPVKQRT